MTPTRNPNRLRRRALRASLGLVLLVTVVAGVLGVVHALNSKVPAITVDRRCYTEQTPVGQQGRQPPIVISGSGFTPNATVKIAAAQASDTISDDSIGLSTQVTATVRSHGNFSGAVPAPDLGTIRVTGLHTGPTTPTDPNPSDQDWEPWVLVAQQEGDAAPPAASTSFHVASFSFSTSPPSGGRNQDATWSFSGFPAQSTIYGHFIQGRRVVTHRFGTSAGPCNVLTAHAKRLPVPQPQTGHWRLQLDTHQSYSARTTPRITAGLSDF